MTTSGEVNTALDKLVTNLTRIDGLVNGSASTDVETDNGTLPSFAKLQASLPGNPIGVTVTTFGATGDGSTDDTSSIQSAIDYAFAHNSGSVIFPAGNYKTTGAIFLDPPANRQAALSYNSASSPDKGFTFTCIGQDGSRMLPSNPNDPCILIGPGSIYVENMNLQSNCSVVGFSAKPNAKTFAGFGYTGAGNAHNFVRCRTSGFYAGWKSTYDNQDNLSSEVTWRQCVGESNYIDVWLVGSQAFANNLFGCRFNSPINIFNPGGGRDVNLFGGSYGFFAGGAANAVTGYTAGSAASSTNGTYANGSDERNILTYKLSANGVHAPLITVVLSGYTDIGGGFTTKDYLTNGIFAFACANLATLGVVLFHIVSFNSGTNTITLMPSPGMMYTSHYSDISSSTATALNATFVSELNSAGRLVLAQMGMPFYGQANLWGGHIETNEMPTCIMYKFRATGTSGAVGNINSTLLQWNRGTNVSSPQAEADAFVARKALPLFFIDTASKARIRVTDVDVTDVDASSTPLAFTVDAAGEGSFPSNSITFDGCSFSANPTYFARSIDDTGDVIIKNWCRTI